MKDVLIVIPAEDKHAPDLRYLTGIINSKALRFYYRTTFKTLHVQNGELASLPLPPTDFHSKAGRAAHDRLVKLVDQILEVQKQRTKAISDSDLSYYESRYAALDHRIDELVYDLYGISERERRQVDAALA